MKKNLPLTCHRFIGNNSQGGIFATGQNSQSFEKSRNERGKFFILSMFVWLFWVVMVVKGGEEGRGVFFFCFFGEFWGEFLGVGGVWESRTTLRLNLHSNPKNIFLTSKTTSKKVLWKNLFRFLVGLPFLFDFFYCFFFALKQSLPLHSVFVFMNCVPPFSFFFFFLFFFFFSFVFLPGSFFLLSRQMPQK